MIVDMRLSKDFSGLKGINTLAQKMVETGKNNVYPLVYQLITLALILPIATTTVERAFSAMNIVKNQLRNRIGEQWMSDSLIVYIEKEFSDCVKNEDIMQRFQKNENSSSPVIICVLYFFSFVYLVVLEKLL